MEMSALTPFFDHVVAHLIAGTSVRTRIGVFYLLEYPGYEGRNPRTGVVVKVPPKKVLEFAASDELATAAAAGRNAETFAEAEARVTAEAEDEEATPIAPSVEVTCADEDLRAFAASIASGAETVIADLETFVMRSMNDEKGRFRLQLTATDALRDRLNDRANVN